MARQWEVRFVASLYHGPDYLSYMYQVCLYGETIEELRQEVRAYLGAHQLSYFDNYGDHIVGHTMYAYSDGKVRPPSEWKMNPEEFKENVGWWCFSRQLVAGFSEKHKTRPYPIYLESWENAVENFVTTALVPQKGPDSQLPIMIDNQLQLPLLKAVLHESEEYSLNDLLRRGWQILALEYQGEVGKMGELINRKAVFVLGHADLPAALSTLVARSFHYHCRFT
jgi:hypothetical protein